MPMEKRWGKTRIDEGVRAKPLEETHSYIGFFFLSIFLS